MTSRIAETTAGKVRGSEIGDGVVAWRGIPYAAPPVGPLRLRLPRPAEPWSGVRDALEAGAPSLQSESPIQVPGAPAPEPAPPPSEDCLYANVTAPEAAEGRPVLVWVHGGGYQRGSGAQLAGGGASFVRDHGLVVVTFNYRLGALGFLSVEGEEHTGAFGLHDQVAVLRWVRDNIAAFGGDPRRITLYGVSAGAKSVANLMATPLTRGLFHRAASSSGGAEHVATPEQSAAVARGFLGVLGTDAGRVRDVPAQDILAAQDAMGDGVRTTWVWRPAIDGLALTSRPIEAIAAGAAGGIPLLAQHCVDECRLYQLADPGAAEQADHVLEAYFGAAGRDDILAAYGAHTEDPEQLRVDVMTDERYAVPTTRLADAQSAHAPVWRSRYDGPLDGSVPAVHGSDAAAVWAGGDGVAGQMHDAWAAFASGEAPAAPALPAWPAYSREQRPTMIFDARGSRVEDDPDAGRRTPWDGRQWLSGTWFALDGIG